MKKKIHPKYVPTAIRCACGNVIETFSTKDNITIQICSSCHPFFTGEQKLIDSSGRIDKFKKKYGDNVGAGVKKKKKTKKKKEKPEAASSEEKKAS